MLTGDGELEPELRSIVSALGLEGSVTFAGYQRAESFVRWLQALDEVWVLGLGNDYSGRAAAQARACGVKVVAVDEGALASLADALVPAPTAAAVADASLGSSRVSRSLPSNDEIARGTRELSGPGLMSKLSSLGFCVRHRFISVRRPRIVSLN